MVFSYSTYSECIDQILNFIAPTPWVTCEVCNWMQYFFFFSISSQEKKMSGKNVLQTCISLILRILSLSLGHSSRCKVPSPHIDLHAVSGCTQGNTFSGRAGAGVQWGTGMACPVVSEAVVGPFWWCILPPRRRKRVSATRGMLRADAFIVINSKTLCTL